MFKNSLRNKKNQHFHSWYLINITFHKFLVGLHRFEFCIYLHSRIASHIFIDLKSSLVNWKVVLPSLCLTLYSTWSWLHWHDLFPPFFWDILYEYHCFDFFGTYMIDIWKGHCFGGENVKAYLVVQWPYLLP